MDFFQVEILAGKDKGKQGKVVEVFTRRNWVIVHGLNTVRKQLYIFCSWNIVSGTPVSMCGIDTGVLEAILAPAAFGVYKNNDVDEVHKQTMN